MRRKSFLLPLFCSAAAIATAVTPDSNTVKILPGDSADDIIVKAANVRPSANQLAALENEFIAFIHFGPNTFTRKEWGNGMEDPRIFDLKTLDTDQWCKAMKDAGMTMVLFTAKHHDGFVLWQSRYTDHGIMSTGFRDGKGDILRDLSESCKKYGLKLGIYLSPADLYQIENPAGLYGNLSKKTKRTIPREVPGRPFANDTKFTFEVDDYNEYFLNQLFELLTEYGPIYEVWFDGAHPKRKGGQTYNYAAWKELIHTLAPNATIFGREDIRWCGNEAGNTRDTEWNVVTYDVDPDTASQFHDMTDIDLGSRDRLLKGKYLHYQPAETNTSIRAGWFYRDDDTQQVRSADDVFDIYERSVGGNSIFLLNIPPNREGRFSATDVDVLREVGQRISDTYGADLLADAKAASQLLDDDLSTYVDYTEPIEIKLPAPKCMNRIVIQEAIGSKGERVESHFVDAWIDGQWREIAGATNIGYKRILRFPDVTTDRIRLRVEKSRLTPAIGKISAHHYKSRPPQLVASRSLDGMVTIQPKPQGFGWKDHGQDITANLSAGYRIHYTTDGSEPTDKSPVYTTPFAMGAGTLKALSVLNGSNGPVLNETMGLIKADWKSVDTDGADKHSPAMAFDENAGTYWQSAGDKSTFTVDLGKKNSINGMAYTPPTSPSAGAMMTKGTLLVSNDGKNFKKAGSFEFGNMVNDPSKRHFYLKKPVSARFVRIEIAETTDASKPAAISEIDIF